MATYVRCQQILSMSDITRILCAIERGDGFLIVPDRRACSWRRACQPRTNDEGDSLATNSLKTAPELLRQCPVCGNKDSGQLDRDSGDTPWTFLCSD